MCISPAGTSNTGRQSLSSVANEISYGESPICMLVPDSVSSDRSRTTLKGEHPVERPLPADVLGYPSRAWLTVSAMRQRDLTAHCSLRRYGRRGGFRSLLLHSLACRLTLTMATPDLPKTLALTVYGNPNPHQKALVGIGLLLAVSPEPSNIGRWSLHHDDLRAKFPRLARASETQSSRERSGQPLGPPASRHRNRRTFPTGISILAAPHLSA